MRFKVEGTVTPETICSKLRQWDDRAGEAHPAGEGRPASTIPPLLSRQAPDRAPPFTRATGCLSLECGEAATPPGPAHDGRRRTAHPAPDSHAMI